jgi:hypothetical protein
MGPRLSFGRGEFRHGVLLGGSGEDPLDDAGFRQQVISTMRGSYIALGVALLVTACDPERSQNPSVATAPGSLGPEPSALHAATKPSKVPFEVPLLRGHVNDYADVLAPLEETDLGGLYESVEREVGPQIALLTVHSLNGVPIEDYSLAVANAWGLGRRGIDDGLLITIAFDDRLMRIEVGYGLELVVSDQSAAEVVRAMGAELSAGHQFSAIRTASLDLIQMIQANKGLVGTRKP